MRLGGKRVIRGVLTTSAGLFLCISQAFAQVPTRSPNDSAPDDSALAAARQLGQEGVLLYERGDYATATKKLEQAYAVVRVPTLGLWSARALERTGKLVEASQRYREVTLFVVKASDPEIFRKAQVEAQEGYDAIGLRIPQVTVEIEGAAASEVSITVDGRPVPSALIGAPVPINPGSRIIEGRRGKDVMTEYVTLAEEERRAVKLVFGAATPAASPVAAAATTPAPVESAPADGQSILPWVVVGAGGAVAVTGGVFIALSLSAKSNVEDIGDGANWSEVQSDYDKVPTYSTLGFVLAGVGVGAITAGLVWKYALLDADEGAVRVAVGPSSVALEGAF